MSEIINEVPKDEQPKKRGRPRKYPIKEKENKVIQPKYLLKYKGEEKKFNSVKEIAAYTGRSATCLFRIVHNQNKYVKRTSEHLKEIHIERINK